VVRKSGHSQWFFGWCTLFKEVKSGALKAKIFTIWLLIFNAPLLTLYTDRETALNFFRSGDEAFTQCQTAVFRRAVQ
jgi:hypothetical protein